MNRSVTNGLSCLALGALLLLPAVASADIRIEARRHFRNGMSLIAAGKFDEGIRELKEAYLIKPHPNVLYNIARAYLDAGRVADALDFYKRYLATNPPDSATVRTTVARLEESLTPPEPPKETRPAPRPPVTSPVPTPAVDPEAVRKLGTLMERLEAAIAKAEALSAPAPAASEGNTPAEAPAVVEDTGLSGAVPYEEQVVTASRRAQSTLEAPNATTIITGEEIRQSGATTLVELLRRVPGADVMVLGVGSANVSLRGFNQRLANKVLVLLDGRTEYQDFLGLTIWSSIPVGLEEIDRIEVIRGPGSALYGANAMLGVINIITRSPGTGPRSVLNIQGGSGESAYGSFVASANERGLRYRASVAYGQADRWSRDFADDRPDIQSNVEDSSLGLRQVRGNLTATYDFGSDVQLGVSAGVNRLFTELYPLGLLRNFYLDGITSYAKADLSAGEMKLKLFWNHLSGRAEHEYSPIGERSTLSDLRSNVFDAELLFSKELELLGKHRVVLGAETRLKQLVWTMAGNRSELHAAAFVQDEWHIVPPVRVVGSFRVDRHPLLDNGSPGYALSPRVSAVWSPFEGHALRAGFATAFREPTSLESYTEIRVPIPGVPGASVLTVGDTRLRAEQLLAYELGYRGDYPGLGLEWDVAAYINEVSNLIDVSPVARLPAGDSFDPLSQTYLLGRSTFENRPATYIARGVEVGAKFSPVDGLDLRASGAFQAITSSSDGACGPCGQAPALKLFTGVLYRTPAKVDFAVEGAYQGPTTWVEREPSPADPTSILEQQNPLPAYAVVNARVSYRLLDDRLTVSLVGTNLGPLHAEHPFGNRIEQRFFATITVVP